MYHYNYGVLVNEKQIEIEKKSMEAWKFVGIKHESFFQKIARKLFTKKNKIEQTSANYCVCREC
ncbi:hypothetical protein QFZ87_004092 [Bacillus sp. SLBN-46]|uniref:hypothetical protein n=1 Tax=Bacillus sp. SLBN-46 TaxID=3042283 RepID=UPI00285ADFCA|nr:hypothetical protein [Bacillus sp. SLBN-46]MDR6124495.1 hypothetical protein [Bacillus sp. SLBN-46]